MTRIIKDIDTIVSELRNGNVAGIPSETVYGLGADALNENAVLKIYETKDRPRFNPIIVHVSQISDLEKYGDNIPDSVFKLAERFSPGPVTFILKKKNIIPDIVTAGNDSVGLRIPAHSLFREVIRESNLPIAAPSANRAGKISPTSAEDVLTELDGRINYILDGGKSEIGIESTVISFLDEVPVILRHGYVTEDDIVKVIGKIKVREPGKFISPGMLKSHYAPSTPLYIVKDLNEIGSAEGMKIGILDFSLYSDLKETALNLFSDLRELDKKKYDLIIAKKVINEGIGIAINDRLDRASSGSLKDVNFKLLKKNIYS
ncbi:MAG TPA: L-threonylcarbamoyladenylate synthase [Ignavibacteria bacterium]|nr:L-threonylcarbamoyladenylate synthase [Ignavibacteria bacterium]HMR40705.1 L-threonylcarbamoyladenylate synthase [Ignavibacteria bacterium]